METTSWGFNRAQRVLLTIAAAAVVIAAMRAAQGILVPFLLSVFIAVLLNPLMNWLRHHRVPTGIAILIVILLFVGVGFIIGALVGSSLNEFTDSIPYYQDRLQADIRNFFDKLEERGLNISDELFTDLIDTGAAMRLTSRLLAGVGAVLSNALLIIITVVFMLLETAVFRKKLENAFGASEPSLEKFNTFFTNINRYIIIKTGASLVTGVLAYILLSILGVDYALLWALITFLLNYVPNIGSIMASIPPILLALIQLGPWFAIFTAIGYFAINTLIGSIMEPRIMGKGLGLSTLVVFLSLLFWGWVLGPVGMLLSVPLTMTLKIALSASEETGWLSTLLDATPGIRLPMVSSEDKPEG